MEGLCFCLILLGVILTVFGLFIPVMPRKRAVIVYFGISLIIINIIYSFYIFFNY